MIMDPSLAISLSRYLSSLVEAHPGRVLRAVGSISRSLSTYAPSWQAAWLLEPLLHKSLNVPESLLRWAQSLWQASAPSSLRVRGALVLAAHLAVKPDDLAAVYRNTPSVAKADLVAAMALATNGGSPSLAVQAVLDSSSVNQWIYDYTVAHSQDLSWI